VAVAVDGDGGGHDLEQRRVRHGVPVRDASVTPEPESGKRVIDDSYLVPRRQNERRVGLGPKRQRWKPTRVDLVNPPGQQQPREEVGGHGDQQGPFACPTDIRPDLLDARHPRRGRERRRHVLEGEMAPQRIQRGREAPCVDLASGEPGFEQAQLLQAPQAAGQLQAGGGPL
jgi:hypothetical protein